MSLDNAPSPARPEPVVDQAKVAGTMTGILTGLGGVAVTLGAASVEEVDTAVTVLVGAVSAVLTAVNVLVPILRARVAREQVTPVSDPRAVDGTPLVPVT